MAGGVRSAERWEGNHPKVTTQCQKGKQNEASSQTSASVTLSHGPDLDKSGSFQTKLAQNPQTGFIPMLSLCDTDVYGPL